MQLKSTRTFLQSILTLSILSFCSLTPSITNAQESPPASPGSPNNPFLCPGGGVDCLIAGYGVNQQAAWLTQPPPDEAQSMALGSVLNQILDLPSANSQTPTLQSIISLMTTTNSNKVNATMATTLPAVLIPPTACTQSFFGGCSDNPAADAQNKANNFSLNSLLNPVSYQTVNNVNQSQAAQNFITWASGLANPISVLDFANTKLPANETLAQVQSIPEVAKYLTMLRTYTAQQAVGISNLYQFYAERTPQTGLGQQALMPNSTATTSESPLQIEQYMATRQIADPTWYASMQNASPAALSRATLFMLAELPPMLYQLHLDMERLTATMSVLELQQTANNRLFIEEARDAAATSLSAAANPKSTTPPVYQPIQPPTQQQIQQLQQAGQQNQ